MSFDSDVLIFGAGPVGLTLANEVARHGAKPMVVDKAPGIREVSKAMILHVRTQEVLGHVGIAEKARAIAQPLTEVVVNAYGKAIGSWNLDGFEGPFRHPLILGQNRTQHLLLDRLTEQGVEVAWNTEVTAFEMDGDGVMATVAAVIPESKEPLSSKLRARFIVGCEGSNSLVRKSLGLTFEGDRYTGEQFIQADCRIKWALPKGRSYLFLTTVGYLMVIEFPDDVVRIFISLPDEKPAGEGAKQAAAQLGAAESSSEVPTLDEVRDALERLSGQACALSDPIWLARYRTSHRYANKFSQGRAFIAGDAGHVHVPIGGQGMNTGIQDAFNLGWKLAGVAHGALKPAILDSYDAERHPVAESLIKGTNFAYTGILHPSQIKQHAARLFGPYLIRNSRVQNLVRDTLEELNVSYPASPLNLDLGGTKGPKPGERVLDATLVRARDMATVTIDALTRATSWTLLVFGGVPGSNADDLKAFAAEFSRWRGRLELYLVLAAANIPEALNDGPPVLLDALEIAHDHYGVSGAAFTLLRPDTYVAARGPLTGAGALVRHLSAIFA